MENNLKFILYCTTNIVNNKIYIGVHKTNPNEFDGYIGCGVYISRPSTYERSKSKFHYAVKKYGVKNFKRSTIQIFDNEEDAYELESYIVNNEFLARPDVYNTALGGTNGSYILTCKKVYQYDCSGNFIVEHKSITDAANSVNRALISIQRAIKDRCKCCDYFWTDVYYDVLDLSKMKQYNGIETIPVFQYSENGEYECCYPSIKEASKVLGKSSSNIGNAIKLGTLCYGKYFTSVFGDNFSISKSNQLKSREIHRYSITGEYMDSYENMAEAKKKLGIKSDIYKAIKLGRLVGGFQWSFEKLDKIAPVKPKSGRTRKVGKFDTKGNLIQEYPSKAKCANENGSGINHVLRGRDKTHKGFVYKYLD